MNGFINLVRYYQAAVIINRLVHPTVPGDVDSGGTFYESCVCDEEPSNQLDLDTFNIKTHGAALSRLSVIFLPTI